MTTHDDFEGLETGRPEFHGTMAGPGSAVSFLPPIPVDMDRMAERESRLAEAIADLVVPRLLALHNDIIVAPPETSLHTGQVEINELARLVLGPDNSDAADYIVRLKDSGVSLDTLHIELLEPTARYLGEQWNADKIDFIDVTIGVSRLQRLVHVFEKLDQLPPYDGKRRVLIATAPGDQHSFGNLMVQKFLRAGGWYVYPYATLKAEDMAAVVSQEWIGVLGISLSSDVHLESLRETVRQVRNSSLNRKIGIMVGGPSFAANPEWVAEVGADGTATNGPAAVILAKKLLVAGLSQS